MNAPPPPDPTPAAVPPGWHPDPWGQAALRWWDGRDWTPHINTPGQATSVVDPLEQATSAAATATWLTKLVLAMPIVTFITLVGVGIVFRRFFDLIDDFDTSPSADPDEQFSEFFSDFGSITSGFAVLQVVQLLALAVMVMRMVWTYRIVNAARALGRGGDREPGLACASWIIPIVNLWWPYQTMRDLFTADERPDNRLIVWWITYLIGTFAIAGTVFALFLPTGALIAVAIVVAVPSAISAVLERRLVIGATASVRRAAEQR